MENILQEIPNRRAVKRTYSKRDAPLIAKDTGLETPPPSSSPISSPTTSHSQHIHIKTVARSSMSLFGTGPKGRSKAVYKKQKSNKENPAALVQMHLNLLPARVTCKQCNMSYTRTSPADVALHESFHKAHLYGIVVPSSIPHTSPRNAKSVQTDSCISTFRVGVCKSHEKGFIERICETVDQELNSTLPPIDETYTAYICIFGARCVSFLLVQTATTAYPFCTTGEVDRTKPNVIALGVSRMWTCRTYRQQGLMRKLLDTARSKFVCGAVLSSDEVGFTQLSQSGESFAKAYTRMECPLVYSD